ncbi:hypothetical protein V2G26_002765 [Clonostachys chloroleuca]
MASSRDLDSPVKGPRTLPQMEMLSQDQHEDHILHRSLNFRPSQVEFAEGVNLHLSDGRVIIDACGGAAVATVGHGQMEVCDAIVAQSRKVSYVHTQAFTTSAAEDLADFILAQNPFGLEKAFFVSSGSEAVESAMKLARQYHFERHDSQRLHFVSRKQSYHGNTLGAMSVSYNLSRKIPYEGFSYAHVSHVEPPFAYRYKLEHETEEQFTRRLLQDLDTEFQTVGPDRIAAFIAEPVIGATAGCVTAPEGYFKGVRQLCDKYGILLILDEIMCGTGRTGTFFAFEQENVIPDIVTAAKGLGGGYAAIAGIYIHRKVVDALRQGSGAFAHGHTYQAHPLACAAALAVQKIIRRDSLVSQCMEKGRILERFLKAELSECKSVGDIRGRGLFWAVEFVTNRRTKQPLPVAVKFGYGVQQEAFKRGVAVYPGSGTIDGINGDHILLAPPFTISAEQLRLTCRVIKEAIEAQEQNEC